MTVDELIGVLYRIDKLDVDVIDDTFMDIEPENVQIVELNGKEYLMIGYN